MSLSVKFKAYWLTFSLLIESYKIYLLIDGLKLENRILKDVGSNESDRSHSLECLYD